MILQDMSEPVDPRAESRTDAPEQASGPMWDQGLAGRLLVAMPNIGDPRFERAVILMCVHSPEQAMGITVNRPVPGLVLSEVMERLKLDHDAFDPDPAVLSGGPVDRERGFVLHTDDFETLDSTLPVVAGVSLTTTREVLEAMADVTRRPFHATLALGCAQWAPGQLEQELAGNVWLTADADLAIIFDDGHDTKWSRALAQLGITADRLSSDAGRA